MEFNHTDYVKLPEPVSAESFDSQCIRQREVLRHYHTNERYSNHCNNTMEEGDDNPFDDYTSNSNNDNNTTELPSLLFT